MTTDEEFHQKILQRIRLEIRQKSQGGEVSADIIKLVVRKYINFVPGNVLWDALWPYRDVFNVIKFALFIAEDRTDLMPDRTEKL